jgi:hypothetical protein
MTGKQNLIPKENFKKVEEVREINNEIPSYEEFLKTYENDGKVNYADLNGGEVGESKGYGSCHTCGNRNLRFRLQITIHGFDGAGKTGTVFSTAEAERAAREIRNCSGF